MCFHPLISPSLNAEQGEGGRWPVVKIQAGLEWDTQACRRQRRLGKNGKNEGWGEGQDSRARGLPG